MLILRPLTAIIPFSISKQFHRPGHVSCHLVDVVPAHHINNSKVIPCMVLLHAVITASSDRVTHRCWLLIRSGLIVIWFVSDQRQPILSFSENGSAKSTASQMFPRVLLSDVVAIILPLLVFLYFIIVGVCGGGSVFAHTIVIIYFARKSCKTESHKKSVAQSNTPTSAR